MAETDETRMGRWTRDGILYFRWSRSETLEKLAFPPLLREKLIQRVGVFLQGEESCHALDLPWRYGIFFYGPSGSGKTAAGKALARALGWNHVTIPAHEILDSHSLERALHDVTGRANQVLVLEDVERVTQAMESKLFFTLLDHAMEKSEGCLWVATSSHPEKAAKGMLIRPGRFDESIRLELPSVETRKTLLQNFVQRAGHQIDPAMVETWAAEMDGLSYAHFEELRQILVRARLEQRDLAGVSADLESFVQDQLISGDRWGEGSDLVEDLERKVRNVDPRILIASLEMTDVFKKLLEKMIGDAAEQARAALDTEVSQ